MKIRPCPFFELSLRKRGVIALLPRRLVTSQPFPSLASAEKLTFRSLSQCSAHEERRLGQKTLFYSLCLPQSSNKIFVFESRLPVSSLIKDRRRTLRIQIRSSIRVGSLRRHDITHNHYETFVTHQNQHASQDIKARLHGQCST